MQCQRLLKQIKSWYIHVSNETMAPARMVAFIEAHAAECSVCQNDPDLKGEIEKITEIVLPESKIPKAVRLQQEQDDMADSDAYGNDDDDSEISDDDDVDDDDDDVDDDDVDDDDVDNDDDDDDEPLESENFDKDELDTDI